MTGKADFTPQEWEQVLEGPTSAGLMVITSHHGGMIRETFSMAKAYAEARQHHGQSALIDEIVAAKPEIDHTRYSSPQEMREHCLAHIRDAVGVLSAKAQPQELEEYKRFVVSLAETVARSHTEKGAGQGPVSDAEREAISAVEGALGSAHAA